MSQEMKINVGEIMMHKKNMGVKDISNAFCSQFFDLSPQHTGNELKSILNSKSTYVSYMY